MSRTSLPEFLRSTNSPARPAETTAFGRVRFTVRQMMVAVAAIALVLGVAQSWRWHRAARDYRAQAATYGRRAIFYAEKEREERSREKAWQKEWDEYERKHFGLPMPGSPLNPFRWQADRCARLAGHYFQMKAKYERAAAFPWLPVEPDPMPPVQ